MTRDTYLNASEICRELDRVANLLTCVLPATAYTYGIAEIEGVKEAEEVFRAEVMRVVTRHQTKLSECLAAL